MANQYGSQVDEGMDVFDINDEKIGSVAEVLDATGSQTSASGGGYLRVPTGFLGLGREHHIPFSAIRSVSGDRIRLDLAKDQLDTRGYDEKPMAMESDADYVTGTTSETATTRPAASGPRTETSPPTRSQDAPRRLQLREEELIARKQRVKTGEVRLNTDVVEEKRSIDVPVTHEEVTIERRAVERRPSDRPIEEHGQTIGVPVSEDQVTLDKRAVVYEEVEIDKRTVQDTQAVSGTVRREEARIEREGNVDVDDKDRPGHPPTNRATGSERPLGTD